VAKRHETCQTTGVGERYRKRKVHVDRSMQEKDFEGEVEHPEKTPHLKEMKKTSPQGEIKGEGKKTFRYLFCISPTSPPG